MRDTEQDIKDNQAKEDLGLKLEEVKAVIKDNLERAVKFLDLIQVLAPQEETPKEK